jgi:hypothetical protein
MKRKKIADHARLRAYAERFFQRSGRTKFPTVRRAAKSLGWTQARVEKAAEGDPDGALMMTQFNTGKQEPLAERFVETIG